MTITEELTTPVTPFVDFGKIARLNRECVLTEKINGTNSSVLINDDFVLVGVGSRNRWITPKDDNYGFARYVYEHLETFEKLGPGHHFGEWWGSGIQNSYGLPKGEKRFSLFNTSRWNAETTPEGLYVVPVLYRGLFTTTAVENCIAQLRNFGSFASPGFQRPEGVVIWHEAARCFFKVTLEKDESPKSLA